MFGSTGLNDTRVVVGLGGGGPRRGERGGIQAWGRGAKLPTTCYVVFFTLPCSFPSSIAAVSCLICVRGDRWTKETLDNPHRGILVV